MLPDRERESCHSVERHGPGDHTRLPHQHTLLVPLALTVLLLIGPKRLTETEVADRQQPPTPQKSSALTRPGAGECPTGVERVPARETQWLVGPGDIDPFRSFAAPVSTPPSGFTPSAAA